MQTFSADSLADFGIEQWSHCCTVLLLLYTVADTGNYEVCLVFKIDQID